MKKVNPDGLDLKDRVIHISRVAKVVKGGRRFSFSAVVVIGDGNGHVGSGLGKANEVPDAIRKAVQNAKRELLRVPVVNGTIPFEVVGKYGASQVIMRPASPGTGVIAGSGVRAVIESAGIADILTKSLGSNNPHNLVKAAMDGLSQLKTLAQVQIARGQKDDEVSA
ncbi:MAG: 30S ribosomal protein S5, small subunit ribosomal protein S5 [Deltaproteobacteria bacterium CSP1-8]|nr:MAG: 30S ribosomal protein S5, small subunit ribosomal protein S5 [Deltaproteobacteria bacterium CSP1-8]